MKLLSTRSIEDIRDVLLHPESAGPDPVYQVFASDDPDWANQTVLSSGLIGQEYPKTYGHYHGTAVDETYQVVKGQGIFVLQSKLIDQGKWVEDRVQAVYLVRANPGDKIVVTPEFGHSWSNVGPQNLVTVDNWTAGHSPTDYDVMKKLRGMAYYLIDQAGQPTPVANPNYRDLPQPIWMTATEFNNRH